MNLIMPCLKIFVFIKPLKYLNWRLAPSNFVAKVCNLYCSLTFEVLRCLSLPLLWQKPAICAETSPLKYLDSCSFKLCGANCTATSSLRYLDTCSFQFCGKNLQFVLQPVRSCHNRNLRSWPAENHFIQNSRRWSKLLLRYEHSFML